jgi:hypothetical protein
MLSCLNSSEDLEGLKVFPSELRVWITIHIIDVTFTLIVAIGSYTKMYFICANLEHAQIPINANYK